ncbi:MAG: squalene/phytoene synthase family protein, partial [Myxococcales bacterium]|nr:squalene/phytoene synthase family protein [Myxococcales bacterium]
MALARVDSAHADDVACRRILAAGSRSFLAASRLLPPRMRQPLAAIYAFCRVADDAIDDGGDPTAALAELEQVLDRVYAATPGDDAVER